MKHFSPLFLFVFLLSLLSLFACERQNIRTQNCYDGTCSYTFRDGRMLDVKSDSLMRILSFRTSDGDARVFSFLYSENNAEDPDKEDRDEVIYFQLPMSTTSFEHVDASLSSIQLIIAPINPFPSPFPFFIQQGSVSGEQVNDNTWKIDFDLTFELNGQTVERQFSKRFKRAD